MRVVIQRVSNASVKCESGHTDKIGAGLLVFLGIEETDTTEDILWLSGKIIRLRIFNDAEGIMNKSLEEVVGEIMVISQFTLHASTRKGNRPSYIRAAPACLAIPLYEEFLQQLEKDFGKKVKHGVFGDHMDISLVNDGPVTILIDTKNKE
jgi:D-aminoacyl-tRNA deacylase